MRWIVRKYTDADRARVRGICCDTALLGEPVDRCFDDRDIAADILVSYYTDCEPESLFVAEAEGEVAGYLAGCINPSGRRKSMALSLLPSVLGKMAARGTVLKKKNLAAARGFLGGFARGEFSHPDFSSRFPASLHVNIDARFRRMGMGAELLRRWEEHLAEARVPGVWLRARAEKVPGFFIASGFQLLFSRRINYLDYLGYGNLNLFVMGKLLGSRGGHGVVCR